MNPLIGLRLAHAKEKALNLLGRVKANVHQDEQELILQVAQMRFATRSHGSLAVFALKGVLHEAVPSITKAGQQGLKLLHPQPSQTAQGSGFCPQLGVGHFHRLTLI
jgi:hypothetical protein